MTAKQQKNTLSDSLKKLRLIADWFDEQDDIDVETGLEKIKEASELIKTSKERLKQLENEFVEVKKKLNEEYN